MARIRAIEGTVDTPLVSGWTCAAAPPGKIAHPSELDAGGARWLPARVPGTAACALSDAGEWTFDTPRDFDAEDWWFRARIGGDAEAAGERATLCLGGLATLADVWLDGEHLLRAENMFVAHEVDVTGRARAGAEIAIRFASLGEELKKRRPRPRWRAQIVTQQQLRWFRTALLGRIPAWAPLVAPVGPYRGVSLARASRLARVTADVKARVEGRDGAVDGELLIVPVDGVTIDGVTLRIGTHGAELACTAAPDGTVRALGGVPIPNVALWWPFTHGRPALYDVRASVRTSRGVVEVDLGRTGFRRIEIDRAGNGFGVRVNGVDVFCRGASWTPLDVVAMTSDTPELRAALESARAAGMNMLRLGGTMTYESPPFHELCDELGILVWQDFMFANMDYPFADPAFAEQARVEATQVTGGLQLSPSLAILCGNTEVAQQAAMLGLPASDWTSALFTEVLAGIARDARPDVPYIATTPDGGALPFRADAGVSHYYGVGAYRRPLEDARRARVRFTAECLAFANVPRDETIERWLGDGETPTTHARWKARVPRDKGASWDFDDVRDHYLRLLTGSDPAMLRETDLARYLEISRVVTGETMIAAISEWRRVGSECKGALVWLLRDFWPGAGWGVVDAYGLPKSAYYFLKRAFAPVALFATDEGVNGLSLHAVNDGPDALDAEVHLALYRFGELVVAEGRAAMRVPAHGAAEVVADALLGRFVDTTYAYRFGPPGHDLAVATLRARDGERLGQAFYFPTGCPLARRADLGVEASAQAIAPGEFRVNVRAKKFAYAVAFDARGFVADDDCFHIEPGGERVTVLRGAAGAKLSARVCPLNAVAPTKIEISEADPSRPASTRSPP